MRRVFYHVVLLSFLLAVSGILTLNDVLPVWGTAAILLIWLLIFISLYVFIRYATWKIEPKGDRCLDAVIEEKALQRLGEASRDEALRKKEHHRLDEEHQRLEEALRKKEHHRLDEEHQRLEEASRKEERQQQSAEVSSEKDLLPNIWREL